MRNFSNLFAAWMAVWAVFFLYEVSIARRIARLQDEIEELKQQLRRPSSA
jgi:CcmD family protein